MEHATEIKFKGNKLERNSSIEELIKNVTSSSNKTQRIESLKKLEKTDLENYDLFKELKFLSLSDSDSEVRFHATRLLYRHYLKQSKSLIHWIIVHDSNYNIPFINFGEQKRYNINDIINTSIENMTNKGRMAENVIESDLVYFLLSWKMYSEELKIYYDLNLKCLILYHRFSQAICYICHNRYDPFPSTHAYETIPLSKCKEKLHFIFPLITSYFGSYTNTLKIEKITNSGNNIYPQIRISHNISDIVIYVDS